MVGKGRQPGRLGALGVTSTDPVLSLLSALGLGQAAGSALIIDLCGDMRLDSARTLGDLLNEGPSLDELSPGRSGVAMLPAGPVTVDEAARAVEALAINWPALVLRCRPGQWDGPTVPVRPLLPGLLRSSEPTPAVWQPLASGTRPTGPGPVLPRLRSPLARRLLAGRVAARSRWVRAWEAVWGMPWA